MKRFLSILAVSALFVALAAVAAAQDKDKDNSPKPKPEPAQQAKDKDKDKDKDKAAKDQPAKTDKDKPEKSDKEKQEKTDKDKTPAKTVSAEPKLEDAVYYPLRVGSQWRYKVGDNKYTLKVAKYEKVGDYNCARVEQMVDDKVVAFEHLALTKDGVVRVAYDDRRADPPLLFLKLPVKKDQTWTVDSVIGKVEKNPGERVTATFKEGEVAKVMVPAGTSENVITCSTQDLTVGGQKMSFTYFFAKNVGMIKQEIDVAGTKVIIDLERYEPAIIKQ